MKKIAWNKLTILFVAGVSPESVSAVIAPRTNIGGEMKERIHLAENGALVQVRDTDPDAKEVAGCLAAKFGQDRVVDASQAKPNDLLRLKREER